MLDAARITAVEIDADAVRFQAETFGVRGVVSSHDPESLSLAGPFDLVLAVSLFSHLPEGRFEAWLGRLWSLVAPRGLLAFSTNGERVMPGSVRMPSSGLAYVPQSETTRLSGEEYGTTWVTPEFVRRAAAAAAPEAGLAFRADGLSGAQDLYVLARALPAGDPPLARDPMGVLEWAAVEGGTVTARGWAQGDADERPPDVKLYVGPTSRGRLPREGAAGLSPRVVLRVSDGGDPAGPRHPHRGRERARRLPVAGHGDARAILAEALRTNP